MSRDVSRALRMLKTALEMEERGFAFYRQATETCRSEAAREVFRTLQMDESVHMKRIRAIFSSLEERGDFGEEWWSIQVEHAALDEMFRDVARRHGEAVRAAQEDVEALEVGVDFEARSVRFYEERLSEATDAVEKRFIEAMLGEERSHHQALQDTKLYLTDPAAWFAANEGAHVDGG